MAFKNLVNSVFGGKPVGNGLEISELDASGTITALAAALPDSMKWQWDDRFDCIVAAFEVAQKENILSAVNTQLKQQWDRAGLRSAPDGVKKAVKDFGGVASNQLLFACGLSEEVMLLGLWWPWGHGATISIRFVPYGSGASDQGLDAVRTMLNKSFGL